VMKQALAACTNYHASSQQAHVVIPLGRWGKTYRQQQVTLS